jgi:hypothetical protein
MIIRLGLKGWSDIQSDKINIKDKNGFYLHNIYLLNKLSNIKPLNYF